MELINKNSLFSMSNENKCNMKRRVTFSKNLDTYIRPSGPCPRLAARREYHNKRYMLNLNIRGGRNNESFKNINNLDYTIYGKNHNFEK